MYIVDILSITDTLGPDIFGQFVLQYRGFPLSEVKNILVTTVGTKIFILIMEVFSIVSLIRRVCLERFHCNSLCRYSIICDLPWENRPSSHLVMIVEIPVLKFLIGITSFCLC